MRRFYERKGRNTALNISLNFSTYGVVYTSRVEAYDIILSNRSSEGEEMDHRVKTHHNGIFCVQAGAIYVNLDALDTSRSSGPKKWSSSCGVGVWANIFESWIVIGR